VRMYTPDMVIQATAKPAKSCMVMEISPGREKKKGLAGAGADQSDVFRERGQDTDFPTGTKGKSGVNREDIVGAEERLPESAESVAAEFN